MALDGNSLREINARPSEITERKDQIGRKCRPILLYSHLKINKWSIRRGEVFKKILKNLYFTFVFLLYWDEKETPGT